MDILPIQVQKDRLQEDLLDLARSGEAPDRGLMRTALSDSDLEAHYWFQGRMRESGLRIHEDATANIVGRLDPTTDSSHAACIAMGSHIDVQDLNTDEMRMWALVFS